VKVTDLELKVLAELSSLEIERGRLGQQISNLRNGGEIEKLSRQLSEIYETVASKRAELESSLNELKKLQMDVELVDKRLKLDESRLNTLTNSKDVTGVQHEIESLKKRISLLEDQELEIMDRVSVLETELESAKREQSDISSALQAVQSSEKTALEELSRRMSEVESSRSQKMDSLSDSLNSAYLRKSERGVAAARLNGRDCGACMIALTSAAYDDVMSTPHDELPTCPNCQALIIR
jgi:predicted  nucleic acid-binding Zn-ribbon protein